MPTAPATFRPPWAPHADQWDRDRGTAAARGYDARWFRASAAYRRAHPLCVCCRANGFIQAAQLVDHVEPHKGDTVRFWDQALWQSLCRWCHNNVKQAIEARWLAGQLPHAMLHLNRQLDLWRHPKDRGGV